MVKIYILTAVDVWRDALDEPLLAFHSKDDADTFCEKANAHVRSYPQYRTKEFPTYGPDLIAAREQWAKTSPVPRFEEKGWQCYAVFEIDLIN